MIERFELPHPRGSTPHLYGEGAIAAGVAELGPRLAGGSLFVVSARPILDLHASALEPLRDAAATCEVIEVADGEAAKSVDEAERLWRRLSRGGGRRDSIVAAFGGGSVCDLAGFCAGTFLRGVSWIAMPSTLLAQVDAAIGGKTAIDLAEAKNAVGLFHHPHAVLAEPGLLSTLPGVERRSGLVEAIKVGAVVDRELFALLERSIERLLAGDVRALAAVAAAAARAKARLVGADPEEAGARQLLNFGHTLGHALEAEVGYGRIAHGDAVAHGMRFALALSRAAGLTATGAERLQALLDRLGVPGLPALDAARLVTRISRDKKARAEGVGWVLMTGLGEGRFGVLRPPEEVAERLEEFLLARGEPPV